MQLEKTGKIAGFITVREAAQKWQVSVRQVQMYCKRGVLDGAFKLGHNWVIPADCPKPVYKFVSETDSHQQHENK